jgi:centromeric protein E
VVSPNFNNSFLRVVVSVTDQSCVSANFIACSYLQDAAANNKEKTKLRMEIRCLRPQLDAHRGRLKEAMDEMKTMDAKYQEASTMLKRELSQNAREVLRLRGMLKELQSASN